MGEKFIIKESELEKVIETEANERGYLITFPHNEKVHSVDYLNAGKSETFFGNAEMDDFIRSFLLLNPGYLGLPFYHEQKTELSQKNFAEAVAMNNASNGFFQHFSTYFKKKLNIYKIVKEDGATFPDPCKIHIAKKFDPKIEKLIEEKKQYLLSNLSRCIESK